ncbi:MAG: hypothetical protein JSV86_05475 [Gemmatimonadota bacterium]|nr:MAG: hypothetical protein JSV86_05475 [Gemmatimonadota bacterium]
MSRIDTSEEFAYLLADALETLDPDDIEITVRVVRAPRPHGSGYPQLMVLIHDLDDAPGFEDEYAVTFRRIR